MNWWRAYWRAYRGALLLFAVGAVLVVLAAVL